MSSVESLLEEEEECNRTSGGAELAVSSSGSNVQLSTIRKHGIIKVLDLFNSKYDCKVCRKKLRYKADEIIHLELKHKKRNESNNKSSSNVIKCPYCSKLIPTYFQLTRHLMIKHLNEKPYGCRLCKKKFFAFIALKQHCLKHHILNHNHHHHQLDENNNNMDANKYSPITCLSTDTTSSSSFKSMHSLQDLIEYDNSNLTYELSLDDLIDMNDIDDQDEDNEDDEIDVIKIDDEEEDDDDDTEFQTLPECSFQTLEFTLITNFNYQQCTKCSSLFKSSSDYLIHCWNEHMNNYKESFFCWMCQKNPSHSMDCQTEFYSDQELKRHLLDEHLNEEYEFKCSMCKNNDQVFLDLDEAHTHFFSAHQHKTFPLHIALNLKFSCFNCEQVFDSLEHIQAHFITECSLYERKSLIKCNLDSLVFNSQAAYEIHLNQHCCLDKTSTSRSLLYRKTPIFKPISKTASKKSLVVTMPLTQSESPSMSNLLPTPPLQQSFIVNAFTEERPPNRLPKQYKCDYCEHCEFATSSELGEHILLHGSSNVRRPFKCHLCQVTFVKVEQLKRHMIVHQAGDFVCPTCFSSFSRRQDLDRHSLFHNK